MAPFQPAARVLQPGTLPQGTVGDQPQAEGEQHALIPQLRGRGGTPGRRRARAEGAQWLSRGRSPLGQLE